MGKIVDLVFYDDDGERKVVGEADVDPDGKANAWFYPDAPDLVVKAVGGMSFGFHAAIDDYKVGRGKIGGQSPNLVIMDEASKMDETPP